jgi:hypothetical protein
MFCQYCRSPCKLSKPSLNQPNFPTLILQLAGRSVEFSRFSRYFSSEQSEQRLLDKVFLHNFCKKLVVFNSNTHEREYIALFRLEYVAAGFLCICLLLMVKCVFCRQNTGIHKKTNGNRDRDREDEENGLKTPPRKCHSTHSLLRTPETLPSTPMSSTRIPSSSHRASTRHTATTRGVQYSTLPTASPQAQPETRSPSLEYLPAGWSVHVHKNGRVFYFNEV